jgi:hypothetical protein
MVRMFKDQTEEQLETKYREATFGEYYAPDEITKLAFKNLRVALEKEMEKRMPPCPSCGGGK